MQTMVPELYEALSRGTIDGAIYDFVGMPSFSPAEAFGTSVENLRGGNLRPWSLS